VQHQAFSVDFIAAALNVDFYGVFKEKQDKKYF
jgi:hypothetical protein